MRNGYRTLTDEAVVLKVKPLTKKVLDALSKGRLKIYGAGHDKILKHWLENLEDWNIRLKQIVWGIRIPVWYQKIRPNMLWLKIHPKNFIQETDTFDTWFSSSQWPVVTLKTWRT